MTNIKYQTIDPQALLSDQTTLRKTMSYLENSQCKVGFVVDDKGTLVGSVTDGDVRRGIIAGKRLSSSVKHVMNLNPVFVQDKTSVAEVAELMRKRELVATPVLNNQHQVQGFYSFINESREIKENIVVLMAGGLGKRLYPMTHSTPKPLLAIGSEPLLETIILRFKNEGYLKFYLAVNYHAEKIIHYFGDGSRFGVEIQYLREDKRLGTAGALSLLNKNKLKTPFFVMNADIITHVSFSVLMNYHKRQNTKMTVCVRPYEVQVPYGVIKTEHERVVAFTEKPSYQYLVNSGIYVLSPAVLDIIPENSYCDMSDVIKKIIVKGREVSAFPLSEYWIDIGSFENFQQAERDYQNVFM